MMDSKDPWMRAEDWGFTGRTTVVVFIQLEVGDKEWMK